MKLFKLWVISGLAFLVGIILLLVFDKFFDIFFFLSFVVLWLPLAYAKDLLKDIDIKIDWRR